MLIENRCFTRLFTRGFYAEFLRIPSGSKLQNPREGQPTRRRATKSSERHKDILRRVLLSFVRWLSWTISIEVYIGGFWKNPLFSYHSQYHRTETKLTPLSGRGLLFPYNDSRTIVAQNLQFLEGETIFQQVSNFLVSRILHTFQCH